MTAFGVWVGIDTSRCSSAGRSTLSFLINPVVSGANSLTLRIKVKDAQGSYFYQDVNVAVNLWQRVTVNLSAMQLESGSGSMSHPLQVVDIGIPSLPPTNGAFYITDLIFDQHQTFSEANRIRLLEFKLEQQGLPEHEWWLDDVGLNLAAEDPYPLAPRLAISLGPYGQNPWRGPTLVHYAHPLAPYLVGALNLSQTYLSLHRDAQEEYHRRYGGVKGPILPVHTRNDLENIALCGEENFCRFCWWPRYRDYGKLAGYWPFNDSSADAGEHGNHAVWVGTPTYAGGLCQPGNTSADCGGVRYLVVADHDSLDLTGDFTFEALVRPTADGVSGGILHKGAAGGGGKYALGRGTDNKFACVLKGAVRMTSPNAYPKDQWYYVVATRTGGDLRLFVNGVQAAQATYSAALGPDAQPLYLGLWNTTSEVFPGAIDFIRIHARGMDAGEIAGRWAIIQGLENGSAYPEVGHALGQYWAFYRLAQYYFFSNDPAAKALLDHWLNWLNTYGAPDGSGWKVPVFFSEYGFTYGTYDPGASASLALGCLYTYQRSGDPVAALWARRLLDDLRLNRQSLEYGGGYKSDYHYGWLNALVIQAFGLAAFGLAGEAYHFPTVPEDAAHFQSLMTWLFQHAGDSKPNLLNADLIPFTYLEAADVWDYAPHYVFTERLGSLEALVLMVGAALAYGKASCDWSWFERLWRFLLADNLIALDPSRIRSLSADYHLAGVKNVVRLFYADYDQDNTRYCEVRDPQAVEAWGEAAVDVDLRYDAPVVLENPEVAQLLASRLLQRLSSPWEVVRLETWLDGARLEIGDTLAVTSPFHGFSQEEFSVFGKAVDLHRRRVSLNLARPFKNLWAWAVDAAGGDFDSYAIDQANKLDANWASRSYAG
ncbi:MAG: LamG-like jellyroll fold domain-containing protein [Desulfobaccales bacterium]